MATVHIKGQSVLHLLMKSMSFPSAATSDGHHWFFPTPFIAIASSATIAITETAHACDAAIAQLGERQTEDLKVPGSIPDLGTSELHFRSISRLDMDELPSQPTCSRRATVLCAVSCKVPRTDLFDSSVYVGLFVHVPRVSGPG